MWIWQEIPKKVKFQRLDTKKAKGKQVPEEAPEEESDEDAEEANSGMQEWILYMHVHTHSSYYWFKTA